MPEATTKEPESVRDTLQRLVPEMTTCENCQIKLCRHHAKQALIKLEEQRQLASAPKN